MQRPSITDRGNGVNILTSAPQSVILDGAQELLEAYEKGEIDATELQAKLLDCEVVYVDQRKASQFKDTEEVMQVNDGAPSS